MTADKVKELREKIDHAIKEAAALAIEEHRVAGREGGVGPGGGDSAVEGRIPSSMIFGVRGGHPEEWVRPEADPPDGRRLPFGEQVAEAILHA